MTNSEAIKLLSQEKIPMTLDGNLNEPLVIAHIKAISVLEENDKLKAEIEQYKSALTTWNNANNEMLKFNQELKDKIEQLKSELERGVNEVKRNILSRRWIYTNDATPVEVLGMDWANRMNDWCVKIIEEAEQSLKDKVKE